MKVGLIISWTLVQHCSGYSQARESSSLITLRGDSFRLSCRHGDGNAQAASAATGALVSPDLAEAPGHPFYRRLNQVLEEAGFDKFCEARCRKFYREKLGRPSLVPGCTFG